MGRHRSQRPNLRGLGRLFGLAAGGYSLIAAVVVPQPHYERVLTVMVGLVIIGHCVHSTRLRSLADDLAQGFARLLTLMAGLVALQSMNEALTLVAGAVTLSLISWAVHKLGHATSTRVTL